MLRANGQQDPVVALLQLIERDITANSRIEAKLHAKFANGIDIAVQLGAWQAICWNADGHHASGDGHGVVDRHAVATARQVIGGGESSRPRPHNGHTFSPAMPGWSYFAFGRGTIVHSEAFQVANGNGCVKFSTPAHVLAGGGADAAADAGKGVRL